MPNLKNIPFKGGAIAPKFLGWVFFLLSRLKSDRLVIDFSRIEFSKKLIWILKL